VGGERGKGKGRSRTYFRRRSRETLEGEKSQGRDPAPWRMGNHNYRKDSQNSTAGINGKGGGADEESAAGPKPNGNYR